jgi:hypothetical protein
MLTVTKEEQQLLAALDFDAAIQEQVEKIVSLLYVAYQQQLPNVAMILINILKKKGVRLTENSDTPLDAGPPV